MKIREFDYVFVGSGVAASTVAKTILESNRLASILILDAGPKVPAQDRRAWWDYLVRDRRPYDYCYDQKGENQSVGQTEWSFDDGRVSMYGGSTVHWGGWCLRFKPEDFEVFSRTKEGADWPISYNTLEPYYGRAEEYLSVCGDDSEGWTARTTPYPRPPFPWTAADGEMIAAFKELGIKPGKLPIARYRKCMTTGTCKYCPFGARFSGQIALEELLTDGRHLNLEVVHNAPVSQINAESKKRIESVEYLDALTGERYTVRANTIIVCAGSYETPKLLHHVDARPVVLQKIHIDCGEIANFVTKISHRRERFQKDLGQDDGRAGVDVNAATVQTGHQGTEQAEIMVRGGAQQLRIHRRMGVGRVGADGNVHSNRNPGAPGLQQQAARGKLRGRQTLQRTPQRLANTHAFPERHIPLAASLFGRTKAAIGQHSFHILAGIPSQGNFKIVDRS